MASVWMVGLEREPQQSGEICVFEVFGDAPNAVGSGDSSVSGSGAHGRVRCAAIDIDISEPHVYGVDWRPGQVEFDVDGAAGPAVEQAPAYPMQMMIAVFDFPEKDPAGQHAEHVPELAVDWIRGS